MGPLGVKGQAELGQEVDGVGVVFSSLAHSLTVIDAVRENVLEENGMVWQ